METKILNAKLDEKIILSKHEYINNVTFTREPHTSMDITVRGKYSWVAYGKSSTWRSIFPMKNTTYVKFFKTLLGAKRNFIRIYLKGD